MAESRPKPMGVCACPGRGGRGAAGKVQTGLCGQTIGRISTGQHTALFETLNLFVFCHIKIETPFAYDQQSLINECVLPKKKEAFPLLLTINQPETEK
jgi:hypothetical protein